MYASSSSPSETSSKASDFYERKTTPRPLDDSSRGYNGVDTPLQLSKGLNNRVERGVSPPICTQFCRPPNHDFEHAVEFLVIPLPRNSIRKLKISGEFVHVQKEGAQVQSGIIVTAKEFLGSLTESQQYHFNELGFDITFLTIPNQAPNLFAGSHYSKTKKLIAMMEITRRIFWKIRSTMAIPAQIMILVIRKK